jgi:hypothetical protein
MANLRIEETVGGFKYMKVSYSDCLKWGGFGVCDLCNGTISTGYLMPVTSGCYCEKCFNKYLTGDRVIDEHDKLIQDDIFEGFFKYHVDRIDSFNKLYGEDSIARICPKCNYVYGEHPAISRVDNKTEICSSCGILEAINAMDIDSLDLGEED